MGKLPDDWEPAFEPHLLEHKWDFEKIRDDVVSAIKDGLPVRDAFILAGVSQDTYYRWRRHYKKDVLNGFTGTRLINLMDAVAKADKTAFRDLSKAMMEKAKEGDSRMMMYLADNRFGYANRRKNNVELGSSGAKNVQINIVDMKSTDMIEERDTEEDIEVNGVCRDDSDSEEMD